MTSYITQEVISITPDRQVLAFKNLRSAHASLLQEYHSYIIENEIDLANKFSNDELCSWYLSLKVSQREFSTTEDPRRLPLEMRTSHVHTARYMWPILIMQGRKTVEKIRRGEKVTSITDTSRRKKAGPCVYFCNYEPGVDKVLDTIYVKMNPQIKALINLAIDNIPSSGLVDFKFYEMIMKSADKLKTRQRPWLIWLYYRTKILKLGFIEERRV
jgi:hypothetical protein